MATRTKTHKTVKITEKMLREMHACRDGLDAIRPLLPLTLSTDPDENMELACVLADSERQRGGNDDVYWLLASATYHPLSNDAWPDDDCARSPLTDPWRLGQLLAWTADFLLTKAGR